MDLELLGTNPTKILNQLTRASRARYRYVFSCADAGKHVDVAVEHQLTNYVLLLEQLAELANVDGEQVASALRAGAAQAQSER